MPGERDDPGPGGCQVNRDPRDPPRLRDRRLDQVTGCDHRYEGEQQAGTAAAAALTGGVIAGLSYAFFAQFEHTSWFPQDLRRTLNDFEVEIFGGLGLFMAALMGAILYRSRAFMSER